MLKTTLFSMALLAATPAIACPTLTDLGKGIEFRTADGDVEIIRQLRPDWITLSVSFADGNGSLLEMLHGIYLMSVIPVTAGLPKPGDREDFASSADLAQWQKPMPDAAWENTTPGGGRAVSGPLGTTMIAGCRFNSFEVALQYAGDDTYTETYDYLTDLGVGLLVKTQATDGTETYNYISVQALD